MGSLRSQDQRGAGGFTAAGVRGYREKWLLSFYLAFLEYREGTTISLYIRPRGNYLLSGFYLTRLSCAYFSNYHIIPRPGLKEAKPLYNFSWFNNNID